MKEAIHPNYVDCTIKCVCGNEIHTRSASGKSEITVEICSNCHPFFTGQNKTIDTAGRIDRFNRRVAAATK